jgi:predicted acyltransferase
MSPTPRLRSLDATRGLVVLAMIAVNTAAYVHYVNGYPVYGALMHSPWEGFTLADAVFPAFVFLVGVSIAAARKDGEPRGAQAGHAAARALRLIVLGVLLSNLYWFADFSSGEFRPFGVLQRIGLAYFGAAVLTLYVGPRGRLAIAAGLLALYWPLCLLPTPDGAADLHERGRNLVGWLDRVLLGPHRYVAGPDGYDPEGVLGTLPALAQTLLGVALGEYALKTHGKAGAAAKQALAGAGLLALGLVWGAWFPIIKDIWTSSFVLVSSGAAMLVFAAAQALLDRPGAPQRPVPVLTAFGANAIAAYVLHMLASVVLEGDAFKAAHDLAARVLPAEAASLVAVGLFAALVWAPMAYLLKRGWLIKI